MTSPVISLGLLTVVLSLTLGCSACSNSGPDRIVDPLPSTNAGESPASAELPFQLETVASFAAPWAFAFTPDGRILVTEKAGRVFVLNASGSKREVSGVPAVSYSGQNGLLDVAVSPRFADDALIYLSYAEPGDGGSSLALARAKLVDANGSARLDDLQVIWRQMPKGDGGQPGGIIAFAPDGEHLFLSTGDRMRPSTAQDPEQALGKVLRLNPDGSTPSDNPQAAAGGVRAQTWTLGHRNPYGLAFAPDGQLWLHEMGPKGGDELNRIIVGQNYGWPIVSNGDNYDGSPIPDHDTRPDFAAPLIYWTPVIAPAGLAFYGGAGNELFPQWRGSAFVGGLAGQCLIRIGVSDNSAQQLDRWNLQRRIRDVAAGPDGALWVLEDGSGGRLQRLVPKT